MKTDKKMRERVYRIVANRIPETNLTISKTLIVFAAISFLFWGIFQAGMLKSRGLFVNMALAVTPCLFLVFAVLCLLKKGHGDFFPYVFFGLLPLFWFELDVMSGYKCKLLLGVLIVASLRYYSKKITLYGYGVSMAALLLSVFANAYLYHETGLLDLNTVRFTEVRQTYLFGFLFDNVIALQPSSSGLLIYGLILTFMPNALFLTVTTVLAFRFMKNNLQNIVAAEESAAREANARVELADMKTKVMLSQVKPHFIYNTLTSIAMLCTKDPKRAKELTLDFSDYLRNNLDTLAQEDTAICPFAEELEHIQTYLAIESYRFENRLKVEYDIQEKYFTVPALSIQPIVENAVKHGVCKKPEGGTVRISTEKTEGGYLVTVKDDGVGFDREAVKADGKTHIGLANIEKRIALVRGKITVESTPGVGTTVTVFLRNMEE